MPVRRFSRCQKFWQNSIQIPKMIQYVKPKTIRQNRRRTTTTLTKVTFGNQFPYPHSFSPFSIICYIHDMRYDMYEVRKGGDGHTIEDVGKTKITLRLRGNNQLPQNCKSEVVQNGGTREAIAKKFYLIVKSHITGQLS